MGKPWMQLVALSTILVTMVSASNATESPQYKTIHNESEFEIRLYRNSTWMSTLVNDRSFYQATKFGFRRLYHYIKGANLNSSTIPMTKPVLTSIVRETQPLNSSAFVVHYYVPEKFQASPPLPLPELNLKPVLSPAHCIAVRKFPGFARDDNVVTEAKKLATSLERSPWANSTSSDSKYAYSIAQYNAPFRKTGRVNEVWIDIDGSESDNCKSSGSATY